MAEMSQWGENRAIMIRTVAVTVKRNHKRLKRDFKEEFQSNSKFFLFYLLAVKMT